MKILFVASECAPFVKTGGLADVIGAVPKSLKAHGAEARVMLPVYPALRPLADKAREVWQDADLMGGDARLLACRAEGIDLLLLDAPHLFDRAGAIYLGPDGRDWPDNAERFAGLSRAAAAVGTGALKDWTPDLVHMHDWQAGLVPAYMSQISDQVPPTVMTIHNIAFQGLFDRRKNHFRRTLVCSKKHGRRSCKIAKRRACWDRQPVIKMSYVHLCRYRRDGRR